MDRKMSLTEERAQGDTDLSNNVIICPAENINKAKAQPTELTETSCFGQRSVSPVPSLLSMKSSDSMMQPINMDGGTGHSDHRSVSPVPSLLSMKSSDSMMQPINVDGGTGHADHRSVSPVPSLLSMKSSDSMMQPINLDGGTGHDHRSVSPVPSLLSLKSSDFMMQPINVDGGTGHSNHRLVGCQLTVKSFETVTQALESEISQLKELDLSYNNLQIVTTEALSLRLQNSQCKVETLRLVCCELKEDFGEFISSVFQWPHSHLKELDLTNNDLCDTGLEFLSNGLRSANCKMETLRLSGCLITEKGCTFLSTALVSNHSHLKELDLSYNHLGDSGIKLLSSQDIGFKLENLNVDHDGKKFLKPGLEKYACELTMDPNTAHHKLGLSKGDTKATNLRKNSHSDHPDRFEVIEQVLCREGLTGRAYWEVEWAREGAAIAVAYRDISRKGAHDSQFGSNNKSWSLRSQFWGHCLAQHNNKTIQVPVPNPRQHRVGVYLDWQAGTLSFYQVCARDTRIHLYTFSAKFTEPLYPGFWVDHDSAVSLCQID
ncbi:NACHT, LRR and PYD domains-containing protein 5-like isoform X12 [Alosa sapidissima]|uniref:NACHT, LRR and PYD domains-containing protein 5-like isoform X12 n=1 Tax=Alosa sapidissima TaxID=34773 RepID=UPI001C097A2B|nr:NACHT, LRR and PYD domains-containing protein 5-like isoform X12 [Alosa sapidissima]